MFARLLVCSFARLGVQTSARTGSAANDTGNKKAALGRPFRFCMSRQDQKAYFSPTLTLLYFWLLSLKRPL